MDKYIYDYKITKEEYLYLRNSVKWHDITENQVIKSLDNSKYIVSIRDDNHIIGTVRCVTDLGYIYLLCDCIVHPDYQGKGIGKMLINEIIRLIKDDNKSDYIRIYIMSLKGKEGFYKSLGFSEDPATGLTILLNE